MKSEKVSKCFDCKNAYAHKCVWVGFGKEIKGFKTEVVDYPSVTECKIKVVRECPYFVPETKKRPASERNKRILNFAAIEGMTVRKIAQLTECSEFTVYNVIKEFGDKREKKCAACGEMFTPRGNAKFCSDKCRGAAGYKRAPVKRKKIVLKGREKNGCSKMA